MNYCTLNGTPTTADDPQRGIWYSIHCSFWSDDWDALGKVGPGIPCCPHCDSVGMQTTAEKWYEGVADYDRIAPRYAEFLDSIKGACVGQRDGAIQRYARWLEENRKES